MDQPNRKRGLADVVGVEAWHRPFDTENCQAELHVDVVFQTARLGGNAGSPVRFKLSVKRAEIVVVLPAGEPVRVDAKSVSRDSPTISGQAKERRISNKKAIAKSGIDAVVGRRGVDVSGAVGFGGDTSSSVERTIDSTALIGAMTVVHMKTDDNFHRWLVSPALRSKLDGRPWDPERSRLTLLDTREDRAKGLAPAVRIEVRCLREDLVISDIALKDETLWKRVVQAPGHRNRLAAAEALIRNQLHEQNLIRDGDGISDPYSELVLAATVAEA